MKNIIDICKELGIEVADEEKLKSMVAENYKTINEYEKKVNKLETERDTYKQNYEEAEETLKGFDGIDAEGMRKEIAEWKEKAENAEKDFKQKLYDRDFEDALNEAVNEIKFTSNAAKSTVLNQVKESGIKLVDGKIVGLNDVLKGIKEKDPEAFVNEEQEQAEQSKAKFVDKMNNNSGSTVTKESIMAIKDRGERRKAIAENMALFNQ